MWHSSWVLCWDFLDTLYCFVSDAALLFVLQVLLPLLKTLKEVNLEYVVMDSRTFVTEHPHAMIR
jgi:hypothetical protein